MVAMRPTKRTPTHPGEILLEEFLTPLGVSQVELARHIGASVQRVNEIVLGKRGVSAETAWLLSYSLGTTPEFWTTLQTNYDLTTSRPRRTVSRLKKSRS
jgi:addiction module HigA family antidote